MEPDEENTQVEKTRQRRPPLLALTFVRKATNADSSTSVEELCDRIYGGVLMNDKKLLSIIWIDSPEYWCWKNDEKEKCYGGEVDVTVAELKTVCWLQISGAFKTIVLSPKTTYEVAFVVKRIANRRGWYLPVNLNLTLPDKTTQGRIENLEKTPEGEWKHILVGTFVTTPENVGEISFSFSETGNHWKSGLLIKGVALRPKD
ncbi:uncharacterized protein PHLOEM PROTEIN 2-LIKE A4-like isoform X2 [Rhodamnia argentea]|uniref:Uncharacterized protein PHLOEM PROTEIN 2-LIKE A4-like isoform X2 n=1 Tax=Rhodamnia argentea TaxID=178133 RepID=A0ABM3GXX5_9MYRT|nr:uncharacterized protein PHLOEM PROTEIN 2-LIKE A4-like isoform X2 [Rhodamnia argentea]